MPTNENFNDEITCVSDLKNLMAEFVAEREWRRFHNAKNLSMALTIEAGELMEHFQWLTTTEVEVDQAYDLHAVKEELADVLSYTLAIANTLGIDVSAALQEKMVKNRLKYPPPPEV